MGPSPKLLDSEKWRVNENLCQQKNEPFGRTQGKNYLKMDELQLKKEEKC